MLSSTVCGFPSLGELGLVIDARGQLKSKITVQDWMWKNRK